MSLDAAVGITAGFFDWPKNSAVVFTEASCAELLVLQMKITAAN